MKNCKECGKSISTDANPCPHCGKKRPHGASPLVKYGGGFLAVMFGLPMLVSFCRGFQRGYEGASSGDGTPVAAAEAVAEESAIEVDMAKLRADYEANEVAADSIYKGKTLAVTGIVGSIDKDFTGDVVLRLKSANTFQGTNAYMQKSEAGGYVIGSPVLRSCRFGR